MSSPNLYYLLLFLLVFEVNVETSSQESIKTASQVGFEKCSYSRCQGRGKCKLDEYHVPQCDCYEQYYQGVNCTATADACDREEMQNIPWIQPCHKVYKKYCFATYGARFCHCHPGFTGELCGTEKKKLLPEGEGYVSKLEFAQGSIVLMDLEPEINKEEDYEIFVGVAKNSPNVTFGIAIDGLFYFLGPKNSNHEVWEVGKSYTEYGIKTKVNTLTGKEFIPQTNWHTFKRKNLFRWPGVGRVSLIQKAKLTATNTHFFGRKLERTIPFYYTSEFQYSAKQQEKDCIPIVQFVGGACSQFSLTTYGGVSKTMPLKLSAYVRGTCNGSTVESKGINFVVHDFEQVEQDLPESFIRYVEEDSKALKYREEFTLNKIINKAKDKNEKNKIYYVPTSYKDGDWGNDAPASKDDIQAINGLRFIIVGMYEESHANGSYTSLKGYGTCFISYLERPKIYTTVDKMTGDKLYTGKLYSIDLTGKAKTLDGDFKNNNWLVYNSYIIDMFWRVSKVKWYEMCPVNIRKSAEDQPNCYEDFCKPRGKATSVFEEKISFNVSRLSTCAVEFTTCLKPLVSDKLAEGWQNTFIETNKQNKNNTPEVVKGIYTFCTTHTTHVTADNRDLPFVYLTCVRNCGSGFSAFNSDVILYDTYDLIILQLNVENVEIHIEKIKDVLQVEITHDMNPYGMGPGFFYDEPGEMKEILIYKQHPFENLRNRNPKHKPHENQLTVLLNQQPACSFIFSPFYREEQDVTESVCKDVSKSGVAIDDRFILCSKRVLPEDFGYVLYYQRMAEVKTNEGFLLTYGVDPYITENWIASSPLVGYFYTKMFNDLHKAQWDSMYYTELHIYAPRERQFGPLNHINKLKAIMTGHIKGVSDFQFDIDNRNYMILLQKLHVINIELAHLSKVTNLEDTVFIDATRGEMNEELAKLANVEVTETFETMQMFSMLLELILLNNLPLPGDLCGKYATIFQIIADKIEKAISTDIRFKKKMYFAEMMIVQIMDCFHGLIYPASADVYEALDDQIAKIIAKNTVDELTTSDVVYEFYGVYDVAFDVLDKEREKYGLAAADCLDGLQSGITLLRKLLANFKLEPTVGRPIRNYTPQYISPLRIRSPNHNYLAYAFLGNFSYIKANHFDITCKDAVSLNIEYEPEMKSSDHELKVVVVVTEFNPYWWDSNTKYHIDQVIFISLSRSGKKNASDSAETPAKHPNQRFSENKKLSKKQSIAKPLDRTKSRRQGDLEGGGGKEEASYFYKLPSKTADDHKYRFTTKYFLPEIKATYGGVANKLEKDWAMETLVTCFMTIITKDMPSRVYVVFNSELQADLYVYLTVGQMPSALELKSESRTKVGPSSGKYTSYIDIATDESKRQNETEMYMVVLPRRDTAVPFHFIFYSMECSVWAERLKSDDKVKNQSDGEQLVSGSTMNQCERPDYHYSHNYITCNCEVQDKVGYTIRAVRPVARLHGFLSVEIDFQMENTMLLPFLCGLIGLIFGGLFFAAYFLDSRDSDRKIPIYIVTNRPAERYQYIIVVITGADTLANTTSHVGIKLWGVKGNSKRHVLTGISRKHKTFKKRAVDLFCLTTAEHLGNIRAVEVWIDHRGTHPSWYLEKLIVRDYYRMIEWVFMARKWFSLIKGEIKTLHRFIYQTQLEWESKRKRVFRAEDFYEHHYWFGMLTREHCHSYSRKAKVLAATFIMSIGSFVSLMIIGLDTLDGENLLDEGHFHTDWAISAGFWGLIWAIFIGYPLFYAIKNSNPDKDFVYYYSDFSGVDPTLPRLMYLFGYTTKAFLTFVQVALIILALFCQMFAGLYYGTRKTYIWAVAVITNFILDLCLVENIHVVLRAVIYNVLMKMPDAQRFCNEIIFIHLDDQIPFANRVNKKARLYYDMMKPVPHKVKRVLKRKEENFKAFRVSIFDFFFFLILFLVNVYLFDFYHSPYSFFSSKVVYHTLIDDTYAGTMGFVDVNTWNLFFKYLNGTLLFSIHWQPPGFIVMTNVKLIGVVRLRQLKNAPGKDYCWPPAELGHGLIDRCDLDFKPSIMDRKSYNPYWTPLNMSVYLQPYRRDPFIFRDGGFIGSDSRLVDYEILPGDGYVAYLGRTPSNTRTALNYLVRSRWFASRTRFVFIDIVFYNVHTNLFSVVTMALGFSRSGDIVRYYHLNSFRAFEIHFGMAILQYVLYVFFAIQCVNIIARHIHQVKYCVFRIQAFQDTMVMALCLSTLLLYALRFIGFREMMAEFEALKLNRYITMDHLCSLEYWSIITTGLLCSQNLSHLIDLGHGNKHIRIFYFMILYAMSPLLICTVLCLIFLISFSCAFHFMVGQENEMYRSLLLAYVETFALPFSNVPTIEFQYGTIQSMIPYFIFTFYGYTFRFLISNMFAVVMVNSYHRARIRLYKHCFQYSLLLYIKERILGYSIVYDMPRKTTKSIQQVQRDLEKARLAKEAKLAAAAEAEAGLDTGEVLAYNLSADRAEKSTHVTEQTTLK